MKKIEIEYRFELEGQQKDSYKVVLDPVMLQSTPASDTELPAWTELGFHQCPNCPLLVTAQQSCCPAAANVADLVTRFYGMLSYDKALVVVVTAERMAYNHTTMQKGICSLMGLLMATSGCPHTAFFKPMARFHLPFASAEETIWRATSIYLVAQFFRHQAGQTPDLQFEGLRHIYAQIQTVNQSFARRLRAATHHDSMVNAIILLDLFAQSMPVAIEASLEEIRHLFVPYLNRIQFNN